MFTYVNHARIHSRNQPVLSNQGKVSCSIKQRELFMGFELTTDRLRTRRAIHCTTPRQHTYTPAYTLILVHIRTAHLHTGNTPTHQHTHLYLYIFAQHTSIHTYTCTYSHNTPAYTLILVHIRTTPQHTHLYLYIFVQHTSIHTYMCRY